jgi:hypothetical protein
MVIKKIIKIAKEIIKPKKTVTTKVIEEIKKEKPLELKKEQAKEIKSETVSENTSSLTRETN